MYPTIHITLPSYAVLAVLGALAAILLLYFRLDKFGVPFSDFIKMFGISIVFGFLGSRVVYIVSRLSWLVQNFSMQNLLSTVIGGGLVFYGGLLGVLLGIYLYCRKYHIPDKPVFNMIAPAIPLFHFFGRIGCYMSGCCYGIELKEPFVLFGLIQFGRIPTQLIEALFELLLFIVVLLLQWRLPQKNHLKIYLISYAIFRFFIEFFRGDLVRGFYFGFSTSQIISIAILVFFVVRDIKNKRKAKLTPMA